MMPFAFLPNLGMPELMIVAFVSLLIFGNRLPSVMRSLGKSVTEFKKGISGIEEDIDQAGDRRQETDPAQRLIASRQRLPALEVPGRSRVLEPGWPGHGWPFVWTFEETRAEYVTCLILARWK